MTLIIIILIVFNILKKFKCGYNNQLCRLDEDIIIVGGYSLRIISILNNKIIKEIIISFYCLGIRLIENKGIFLIGGKSKEIRVYRYDNYECIQIIQNAHDNYILGFIEIKNGLIYHIHQIKLKK